jgi:hypothetical protein
MLEPSKITYECKKHAFNGWQATTVYHLPMDHQLIIDTSKSQNQLITRATVYRVKDEGSYTSMRHTFGMGGAGDYSRRLAVSDARCTEKNVAYQHDQTVSRHSAQVMLEVEEQYGYTFGIPGAHRTLHAIASEIDKEWANPYFGAVPYLAALRRMTTMRHGFGADDAKDIVLHLLGNMKTFTGDAARRIKLELKAMAGVK